MPRFRRDSSSSNRKYGASKRKRNGNGSGAMGRGCSPRSNRDVKRTGTGVRIVHGYLPITAPWLNPIEPKWAHGKRRVVEPARLLSADELIDRVYAAFDCDPHPVLAIPAKAA